MKNNNSIILEVEPGTSAVSSGGQRKFHNKNKKYKIPNKVTGRLQEFVKVLE